MNRTSRRNAWRPIGRRAVDTLAKALGGLKRLRRSSAVARARRTPPVVICPYLYDHEAEEIRAKFRLDEHPWLEVNFCLWQDRDHIGPEFAFERCWNRFPDRDVIIIHSDMAPMPGEPPTRWYAQLVEFRDAHPDAGMIACNLFYPRAHGAEVDTVQCAGGLLLDGRISHLSGEVGEASGLTASLLASVRQVEWVTFGGLLIRREVIEACGPIDRRYKWAYVLDVDYCFEARRRGFKLLQVPVSLQHEESRTTRRLWEADPSLRGNIAANMAQFYSKWAPMMPMLRDLPDESP